MIYGIAVKNPNCKLYFKERMRIDQYLNMNKSKNEICSSNKVIVSFQKTWIIWFIIYYYNVHQIIKVLVELILQWRDRNLSALIKIS